MSTTSLVITRTELGLQPLHLHVEGPGPGYRSYGKVHFSQPTLERTYAPSVPWAHYEHMTHVRKTNGTYSIPVLVTGTDSADLVARLDELEEAFDQWSFEVSHTYGGITRTWRCNAADVEYESRDRDLDAVWAAEHKQPIIFTGPHRGPA